MHRVPKDEDVEQARTQIILLPRFCEAFNVVVTVV